MLLLTNIFSSIIFIIVGVILKVWPPKEINYIFGYRTFFAMKNQETWKEGNEFSGTMMILSGVIALIFSLLITVLYWNYPHISTSISSIGTILLIVGFVFYTEIHLRKIFDENGKRRTES